MDFELKNFEDKINDITEQFMSLLDSNKGVEDRITTKFDNLTTNAGGIFKFEGMEGPATSESTDPAHVIRFDEADDLNKRLEELYNTKKYDSAKITKEPQLAFADYGLGGFNTNIPATSSDTNDKIYSANEKEDNDMANYGYNVDGDSSIFSFATVPQERALAPQRSFSDVLFMDIPWDTKVDVWGGIKSFFNAQVKFTY